MTVVDSVDVGTYTAGLLVGDGTIVIAVSEVVIIVVAITCSVAVIDVSGLVEVLETGELL